jgi:hypothetical protein
MRAVGFGLKEHFEQAWGAQVENRVAVAGGEVTQGASDKIFAHPGDRSGARCDGGRSNREREQESKKRIGFLNDLFYDLAISHDRQRCQFLFLLDEKPTVCAGRLGRRAVGRQAEGFLWRRSVELRASGAVGLGWQAAFCSSDRLK